MQDFLAKKKEWLEKTKDFNPSSRRQSTMMLHAVHALWLPRYPTTSTPMLILQTLVQFHNMCLEQKAAAGSGHGGGTAARRRAASRSLISIDNGLENYVMPMGYADIHDEDDDIDGC